MAAESNAPRQSNAPRGRKTRRNIITLFALCTLSACMLHKPRQPSVEEPVFYPPLPQTPRIQFLATYNSESDVVQKESGFRRFIVGEADARELGKVYGVALKNGQILVCDTRAGAVIIFDLEKNAVDVLGTRAPGKLSKPVNIAVDEDGRRYVVDSGLQRVVIYDRGNRYLGAFGDPQHWKPSDVAIYGDRLYVTDLQQGQVAVLDKASGKEITRFSQEGDGPTNLFLPTNIDVDTQGDIYVTDTGNFRVQKFSPAGTHLRQFGSLGRSAGQFARPKGVAVDREGRLYVVDAAFENIQIFSPDGKLLLFFGEPGNHPGGINLPAQVEIDYENVGLFADRVAPGYAAEYLILVTSQFGKNKVNVYGFLKPKKKNPAPENAPLPPDSAEQPP